jgi:hypothetical protein
MRTIGIASVVSALAIITAVSVTPSQAQPPAQSVQAALSQEAGTLSDKFTGLARVMAGRYDWKPGQGCVLWVTYSISLSWRTGT